MSAKRHLFSFAAVLMSLGLFTGCESTDGGGSVSGGMYYGAGFHDPWYYGGYDNERDIIVTPPSDRPERPGNNPPGVRPTPMPSIPSAPRPMPRGGGGGGRR